MEIRGAFKAMFAGSGKTLFIVLRYVSFIVLLLISLFKLFSTCLTDIRTCISLSSFTLHLGEEPVVQKGPFWWFTVGF